MRKDYNNNSLNPNGFVQVFCCAFIAIVALMLIFAMSAFGGLKKSSSGGGNTNCSASTLPPGSTETLQDGSKTLKIPTTCGKVGSEKYLGNAMTFGSTCNDEEEKWYITMRWPYVDWAFSGDSKANADTSTSSSYAAKKVLVLNPKSGKKIVTAICEAGPAPWTASSWFYDLPSSIRKDIKLIYQEAIDNPPSFWAGYLQFDPSEADGRVSGLPPVPMQALGAQQDDVLNYGFADQSLPLGEQP